MELNYRNFGPTEFGIIVGEEHTKNSNTSFHAEWRDENQDFYGVVWANADTFKVYDNEGDLYFSCVVDPVEKSFWVCKDDRSWTKVNPFDLSFLDYGTQGTALSGILVGVLVSCYFDVVRWDTFVPKTGYVPPVFMGMYLKKSANLEKIVYTVQSDFKIRVRKIDSGTFAISDGLNPKTGTFSEKIFGTSKETYVDRDDLMDELSLVELFKVFSGPKSKIVNALALGYFLE